MTRGWKIAWVVIGVVVVGSAVGQMLEQNREQAATARVAAELPAVFGALVVTPSHDYRRTVPRNALAEFAAEDAQVDGWIQRDGEGDALLLKCDCFDAGVAAALHSGPLAEHLRAEGYRFVFLVGSSDRWGWPLRKPSRRTAISRR